MRVRSAFYATLLLLLFSFVLLSTNHQTLAVVFQTTWGGTSDDVAQGVAVDSLGNSYITGYTNSFGSTGIHVFLVKLDSTGNILWQQTWGGAYSEFGKGVAVDPQGNVYVAGYTSSFGAGGNDLFLLKWNSAGSLLWQRTWGGSEEDLGVGVAVNSTESVYVVGYSSSVTPAYKAVLIKFDPSGTLLWQRTWGGATGTFGQGVAVDSSDGVYLTGFTSNPSAGAMDIFLLKFSSSGAITWQRTLGTANDDFGHGLTVDPDKNAYVIGSIRNAAGNDDLFIMKVNSTGSLLWRQTWGGGNTDVGHGISADSLGYIYATGRTASFGGSSRVFLMALDSAGSMLWETLWGGVGADASDEGLGITAAGSGYVVATGFVTESAPHSTGIVETKFSTSNLNMIIRSVSPGMPGFEAAISSGDVTAVSGSTTYSGGQDAFAFKHGAPTPPTVPSKVTAAGYAGYVNLTWGPPAFNGFNSITGYNIYRGDSSGRETFLASIGNQTFYTDSAISGGATYYYWVTALNAIGESLPSNEATPPIPPTTVPTIPRSLTAQGTTGQVILRWNPPASNGGTSILAYNIYRSTSPGGESLLATIGAQTNYNDTAVTGGVTYYYKVTAVNIVGESARSSEASAIPTSTPTPPQGLLATSGLGEIVLSWNPPASNGGTAITGYNVYRGITPGGETLLASLLNQLSYEDQQVDAALTYYYTVTAVNAVGESSFSNEVSATPSSSPGVPSPPLNLAAIAGRLNVTLTWSAPLSNGGSPIQGYNIYRGIAPGSESLIQVWSNQTTFTDTNVVAGVTYYYRVDAFNNFGRSLLSNQVSARPITTPSSPQDFEAIGSYGRIHLIWTPPASNGASPITGYSIYRATSPGTQTLLATIGNQTSYADIAVTTGTPYFYTITALNAAGESPHSQEASATASASPIPPSAPRNLIITTGNGTAMLTWSPPVSNGGADIQGYEVWRGTTSGSLLRVAQLGNQTSYTDSGLTGGTPYYYQVRAVNSVGPGAFSNEVSATPTSPPTAPQNLTATPGAGNVTLNWGTPSSNGGLAINGYKVYRGTSAGGETLLTTINNGNQLSYVDTAVTGGTTYYYKVEAFNSLGESEFSNGASATPSSALTVPDPPTNLMAVAGVNNVTLTWSPPIDDGGSPVTEYQIWRGTSSGTETFLSNVVGETSYVDLTAMSGTTYYYYVRAVNSVGPSNPSNEVSATPRAPATAPSRPENLQAMVSQGTINLTWSPPLSNGGAAITGYRIYRGTSPGTGVHIATVDGSVRTYVDTMVEAGTTYYYRITATNSVGGSPYSIEVSAVLPPSFNIIPVAVIALLLVALAALLVIFWRRRVSHRLMMPP